MVNESNLIISENDFQKLSSLIMSASNDAAEALEEEISRASIVKSRDLPADVVSMNSTLKFIELSMQTEKVVTLVYPHEADSEQNKISVLAPVGSALIGLRVGQVISWPMPNGQKRKFKIVEIISQQRTDII